MTQTAAELASAAWVDPAVLTAHPGYTAVVVSASGLRPGAPTDHSEQLLADAERQAQQLLAGRTPAELPEIAAWRDAFAAFGVKQRVARSSAEALLRRVDAGLPRIDRLTDVYNAVSVRNLTPLGGEDATGYVGAPRLVIATGDEDFDTVAGGEPVVESAAPGEVIWRDDAGVTCRRWNWRQCTRTRLGEGTTEAFFIIDALGPDAAGRALTAASELTANLAVDSPDATFTTRVIAGDGAGGSPAASGSEADQTDDVAPGRQVD